MKKLKKTKNFLVSFFSLEMSKDLFLDIYKFSQDIKQECKSLDRNDVTKIIKKVIPVLGIYVLVIFLTLTLLYAVALFNK